MVNLLKNTKLIVIVLFVTASIFRIFHLNLIEFKYDEAYTVFQLEQFFNHPYLMQTGPPQSTGAYNPPLFNYIMIILSLFSRYPEYLSFLIALINTISVVAFYLIIKKFYGFFIAFIAGLILATSPWSIIFSRKIWIPDLLLPLSLISLYYLHQLVQNKKTQVSLPLFLSLALLPQMHASGAFFFLTTLIILMILKVKVDLRQALVGFAIGMIPALPYFIRQITSTPFCVDCVALFSYQEKVKIFDPNVFIRQFQFLGGFNFEAVLGQDHQPFLQTLPFNGLLSVFFVPYMVIIIFGVITTIRLHRKHLFLIFYLLIMPSLYFFSQTPSYMHYFVILSPIAILFTAISTSFLWNLKFNKLSKLIILIFLVAIVFLNIAFHLTFTRYLSQKQDIKGDYGKIFQTTSKFIENELADYSLFSDYDFLKSYGFVFAQTTIFHQKLAEYFIQTDRASIAMEELNKALQENPLDVYSRANLIYLLKMTGKINEAQKEMINLENQNSTAAAQLKTILDKLSK